MFLSYVLEQGLGGGGAAGRVLSQLNKQVPTPSECLKKLETHGVLTCNRYGIATFAGGLGSGEYPSHGS